jgi:hypothetical protein
MDYILYTHGIRFWVVPGDWKCLVAALWWWIVLHLVKYLMYCIISLEC